MGDCLARANITVGTHIFTLPKSNLIGAFRLLIVANFNLDLEFDGGCFREQSHTSVARVYK